VYLYETCLKYEMSEEATWAGLKKHLRESMFVLLYQLNGVSAKFQFIQFRERYSILRKHLGMENDGNGNKKRHLANKTWQGETWRIYYIYIYIISCK
jgi:hypothetical protein